MKKFEVLIFSQGLIVNKVDFLEKVNIAYIYQVGQNFLIFIYLKYSISFTYHINLIIDIALDFIDDLNTIETNLCLFNVAISICYR